MSQDQILLSAEILRSEENENEFIVLQASFAHALSSLFVTARKEDNVPVESIKDLNNPTPNKKLRAFCLAFASGIMDSACLTVNSYIIHVEI